ncbi:Hydrogenase maturation protein, carbamoyltransferase HypF [Thermodesulfobium acidiphilum]|uniref:Carbamoyltransferase n=1 Tax=Thermodesulfobium acidiphilum TaxID=1794699 RepID=A0A2R4W1U9_THEAF|nr:carbamoyltransferase HypF [Thermodesulfobium acidiphilum]AWB10759.1 Hydrogenase maturation protein, carbamoyltransferase HypF [Thermodesulfobium acidiphilum]
MLKHIFARVEGIVQGVGFRPFIYRLAKELSLNGYCLNDTEGVTIEVEGEEENLSKFLIAIKNDFPPLAVVSSIRSEQREMVGYRGFVIDKSKQTDKKTTFIPPDTNVCDDCLRELFDKTNRRFHYPFITCTNCGPRFSIIYDIPYDRKNTTMNPFELCPECKREYSDPLDRRFHTQPTACPLCGPSVYLYDRDKNLIKDNVDDIVKETYNLLMNGKIVAIKGLGGFHLAVDAKNDEAVLELRKRKRRPFKPFALMANINAVSDFLYTTKKELELLTSRARPIVLLKQKEKALEKISRYIAPDLTYIGIMLPYTPFQYLLFDKDKAMILVMTSANLSDEPIVYKDDVAFEKLYDIADYFVTYNREIAIQSDDSVMFVLNEKEFFVRRSRGFVPIPFFTKKFRKHIFAAGADLKSSFALSKDNVIFLSQYLGDLESVDTYSVYKNTLAHFEKVFDIKPEVFISDLHPNYFTTRLTDEISLNSERLFVQHHHAHIAAVMEEHGIYDEVIGLAFDGTGYGTDGRIWGSEFLLANRKEFKRVFHFSYFKLPGSEKAIKEIYRIGLSLLYDLGLTDIELAKFIKIVDRDSIEIILSMLNKNINCPLTCSIGRLFDGVAAILGVSSVVSTEAEAAQKLEELALTGKKIYPFEIDLDLSNEVEIPVNQIIKNILEMKEKGVPVEDIALSFHNAISQISVNCVQAIYDMHKIRKVVLCGGAFVNKILLKRIWEALELFGFEVFLPHRIPLNDSSIALGQISVGKELIK